MPDNSELRFEPADYRVRLFLSVDLSGSTAFKNSTAGEDQDTGSAPRWVTIFQQFYTDFPALFRNKYQRQTNASVGTDGCPELWKAVGDELIFCGRISNTKAAIVALNTFIATLHLYRKKLLDDRVELNVKGAGWLAAFPEPNRAVQLRALDGQADLISASEALEKAADQSPFDYDFLGKAIDTGFRVAANSKPERFVLSVQLARLLAGASPELGFAYDIRLEGLNTLKGVNRNEPYPMLYIDTLSHLPMENARRLQREVLRENDPPTRPKLYEFLQEYCAVVGTDEIMLGKDANAAAVPAPESYTKHRGKIAEHLLSEKGREFDGDAGEEADSNEDVQIEEPDLEPLSSDTG
ncbi:hypothetical protein [uncultured Roseobacter sp.]|uniref:hypothetical protein n=1 Tax=uncultured Roseobacter sp. TaxID=114847 RepID=UPI002613D019|nr:hypothetical protein [uncultured Roseobacter sp.]